MTAIKQILPSES